MDEHSKTIHKAIIALHLNGFVLGIPAVIVVIAFAGSFYLHTYNHNRVESRHIQSKHQSLSKTNQAEKLVTLSDFNSIIKEGQNSVVKVTGSGCGYTYYGTGFVVGPGLVATNAHVIAGMNAPIVVDGSGEHRGVPVLFDPELDFAVLRVNNLASKPLALDTSSSGVVVQGLRNGDREVMLGYPGGGSFSAELATVNNEQPLSTYDIYGNPLDRADTYEISGNVVAGDSGSPLIRQDGSVAGIMFGLDTTTNSGSGWALPASQFTNDIRDAMSLFYPVDITRCTPGT